MKILQLTIATLLCTALHAQMKVNNTVKLGNEWLEAGKEYHKVTVKEDGIYRISFQTLADAKLDVSQVDRLQLWNFGKQIPIYVNGAGDSNQEKYIEFVGFKHRLGLDTFLYEDWKNEMLNPDYSNITDASGYYLTIGNSATESKRYNTVLPNLNSTPAVQNSFLYKSITNYANQFFKPEIGQLKFSHFVSSEGFQSGLRNNFSATVSLPFREDGTDATLSLKGATNLFFFHNKTVEFNGNTIGVDSAKDFGQVNFVRPLKSDQIKESNSLNIKNDDARALFAISNMTVEYRRKFNMSNINFATIPTLATKGLINLDEAYSQPYIYDVANQNVIVLDPTKKKIYTEPNGNLAYATKINTVTTLQKISNPAIAKDVSYLILTSKKLAATPKGQEGIDRYKSYRSSAAGGKYTTDVYFVEDLNNVFGYGVDNHPHAFKNFAHYLKDNHPNLKYVLLLGKGREYYQVRTEEQLNSSAHATYYVPTYGTSPSDVLLFSKGLEAVPFFSIGRVAVRNGEDIANYLDKVIEHDAALDAPQTKDKMWLKNVMHLGGGGSLGEQNSIQSFLKQMGDTISSNLFGGKVNGYYKSTTSAVQTANVEGIYQNMNFGTSIITYFGHASVNVFEYNLDNPRSYNNKGKYPYIFSLGCYSGNIHTPGFGISEDFVLAKDRGAIGFVAAAGTATLYSQGLYGINYYGKVGKEYYGKSVGELIKLMLEEARNVRSMDPFTFYQQITLNGDPAVRFAAFDKPDYAFDYESVKLNPGMITEGQDTAAFNVNVLNIGRGLNSAITVNYKVVRNDNSVAYSGAMKMPAPKNTDLVKLIIPTKSFSPGTYKVEMEIDGGAESEITTANNALVSKSGKIGYDFSISGQSLNPWQPERYAVVNGKTPLTLQAYSVNAFKKNTAYVVEIDTSFRFNSPIKERFNGMSQGSYIKYEPKIKMRDGQNYYWRVSYIDPRDTIMTWKTSTFAFDSKAGEDEYSISGKGQFETGKTSGLTIDENGQWQFGLLPATVQIASAMYKDEEKFGTFNGSRWASLAPLKGNASVVNLTIWNREGVIQSHIPPYNKFNHLALSPNLFSYDFKTKASRDLFIKMIEACPSDAKIMVFVTISPQDLDFRQKEWESDSSSLGTNVIKTLKKYGALAVQNLTEGKMKPYIFVFSKAGGYINEVLAQRPEDDLTMSLNFEVNEIIGKFTTGVIGPVKRYTKLLISKEDDKDAQNFGLYSISLLDQLGNEIMYLDSISGKREVDISTIDANKYPYMKVGYKAYSGDWIGKGTPVSLKKVALKYEAANDLLLLAEQSGTDTIEQGEPINIKFNAISLKPFEDSVSFVLNTIKDNVETLASAKKLKVNGNKENFTINTSVFQDAFTVTARLNSADQPREINKENNTARANYTIKLDKISPELGVTFDGRKIINGDLVSPKPMIKITLKDENKRLKLVGNENLKISLLAKATNKKEELKLVGDPEIVIKADNTNQNGITCEINRAFIDGEYTLFVQGTDQSNNKAAAVEYMVDFAVISEVGVRELTNYPNPFSTSTKFVFSLTGEVPEDMVLRIYTMSGKVVREYTLQELGSVHVGNNLSSVIWDGTDATGSKLANGVYLMKLHSKQYSKNNKTTKTMQNGFSKLVILR